MVAALQLETVPIGTGIASTAAESRTTRVITAHLLVYISPSIQLKAGSTPRPGASSIKVGPAPDSESSRSCVNLDSCQIHCGCRFDRLHLDLIDPSGAGNPIVKFAACQPDYANFEKTCARSGDEIQLPPNPCGIAHDIAGLNKEFGRIIGIANLKPRPAVRGNSLRAHEGGKPVGSIWPYRYVLENQRIREVLRALKSNLQRMSPVTKDRVIHANDYPRRWINTPIQTPIENSALEIAVGDQIGIQRPFPHLGRGLNWYAVPSK